jgi:hypothetical protein
MNEPTAHNGAPAQEVRVSILDGDRPCIRCGFNLQGQPVVREPVYGMIMVRCPECSTVASLQEYPLLGRWAGRFAALLAAAWVAILLAGLFITVGISFGMTESTVLNGGDPLATEIARAYIQWYDNADDATKKKIPAMYGVPAAGQANPYTWVDSTWWSKQDPNEFVAKLGGVRYTMDRNAIENAVWVAVAGFIMGIVWSIILLGLRRMRLLIFGFVVVGLALGAEFVWGTLSPGSVLRPYSFGGTQMMAREAATNIVGRWLVGVALGTLFISVLIGLWSGRPITRWFIRLLLPPRLWAPLSFLWIAEGRALPRPRKG